MRLIDADALKEEVKTIFCPDGYKIMMLERIDNAPELGYEDGILSVENATRKAIELEEAYSNGWSDGFSEGENERPKGEWIKWNFKDFGAFGDWEYKCSNCEKVYGGEYNFCPNCGARMQKGGAE